MIKANKGEIELSGELTTIRAEFTCIAKALMSLYSETLGEEKAKRFLYHDLETSFMSEKELCAKILERITKLVNDVEKANEQL